MSGIDHLLLLADEYMRATSTKEVTLSYWLFSDSKKLKMLRGGADITLGRFNAALIWFSGNWPEGAEWPVAIARPMPEAAE